MKIIELLNKIANGEKVPKKIKYRGNIYELEEGLYYREDGENITLKSAFHYFYLERCLNDEVEIIEEDKKIEKIEKLYKYNDKEVDEKEKDMYYENILKVYDDSEYEIDESISFIVDKINEIIDYLEEKE